MNEYARATELLRKYDLTPNAFEQMLDDQGGRCAICGTGIRGLTEKGRTRAYIDHDHETGKKRSLLCNCCNTGLGMFRDSIRNLASAIVYLEDHGRSYE